MTTTRFIYALTGPRGVYIGQTKHTRGRHREAVMVGALDVLLELPDATWSGAEKWEDRTIAALRARGVIVVNSTNRENDVELAKMRVSSTTHEERCAIARKGAATYRARYTAEERSATSKRQWEKRTAEERRAIALKGAALVPPDVRSDRTRRAWITRRGGAYGHQGRRL